MVKIYKNLHFGLSLRKFPVQILGNPNIAQNFKKNHDFNQNFENLEFVKLSK